MEYRNLSVEKAGAKIKYFYVMAKYLVGYLLVRRWNLRKFNMIVRFFWDYAMVILLFCCTFAAVFVGL